MADDQHPAATASDLSQTKADFVFQGASLAPVLATWRLARRADRLVLQNIAFALVYNAVAIPAAMAGLVTPLIAALACPARPSWSPSTRCACAKGGRDECVGDFDPGGAAARAIGPGGVFMGAWRWSIR